MNAPIGIMVLSNRRIRKVNTEIELLFGWNRPELEGQSVRMLCPSGVDYQKTGTRWLANRPRYEDEHFMQRKSGEIIWTRANGRTLTPAEPFRLMVWTFSHLKDPASGEAVLPPRNRRSRTIS